MNEEAVAVAVAVAVWSACVAVREECVADASTQKSQYMQFSQLHLFSFVCPSHQDLHGGGGGGGGEGGGETQKPQPEQEFHPHFFSSVLVLPSHQLEHGAEGGGAGGEGG